MPSSTIHDTTALAFQGKISFAEVIEKLIAEGCQRYHVDLVTLTKSFYFKDGMVETINLPLPVAPDIGEEFDAAGVIAAIKLSQGGKIIYPQFIEIVMKAGCTHYDVYIEGKQVIYFGRKGDFHEKKFPQAK